MRKPRIICLLGFVGLIDAEAQTGMVSRAQGQWGVGAAVIVATSPYRGSDTTFIPIPMISYTGPRFNWAGPRAGYRLMKNRSMTLSAVAEYRFYGALDNDNEFMRGMHDRKGTLESGLEIKGRLPGSLSWELKGVTDVLGIHQGQEVQFSVGPSFRRAGLMIKPAIGLRWISHNASDYYFGVDQDEAAPGRPAYTCGSALNWAPRITLMKTWCTVWSAIGTAGVEFLDSPIVDSPIIDTDRSYNLIVGISRSF